MDLSGFEIARMIDLSAVRADDDEQAIVLLVSSARKFNCRLVETLPSQTYLVKDLLAGVSDVGIGGNVGFPSGGQTTRIKVAETKELLMLGCHELDVVINISKLLSGRFEAVLEDTKAVVEAAGDVPVKVIIECHYLSNYLIKKACDICIAAGASWVKTGTGWTLSAATKENIALIKTHVGDAIGVKASGGIRDLESLLALYRLGARRFGIGLHWGVKILEQVTSMASISVEM